MICPACGFANSDPGLVETQEIQYEDQVMRYSVYECWECSTQFADPRKQAPPRWYSDTDEYYGWRWEFERFIDDLEKLPEKPLRVLEIGCGEGVVLEKLNEHYEVWGLDFNKEAIHIAKSKGLRVFPTTIEAFKAQNPERKFDVVAFFHVIEHLENPVEFLTDIRGILNPEGYIFLSTPNPDRTC